MPSWHSTFERMRGITRSRDWMTWGEFQGLLGVLGVSLTDYHVRQATKACPPAKRHGAKRYLECHVQMAVGYAQAKGLARRQEATA